MKDYLPGRSDAARRIRRGRIGGFGRSRSKKGEVEDWSVVRLLSHGSKNIVAPGGFSAHGQGCAPLHTSTTAAPLGEDVEVVEDGGYRQSIQFRW